MLSIHQISVAYSIPPDDVEFTLIAWAAAPTLALMDGPCWLAGPAKFRVGRQTVNPLRALGAAALGYELDPSWRLHRKCSTPSCRNLTHYELKIAWDATGVTEPKDLPA